MSQEVKGLRPGMWCKPKDKQEWQLLRHLAKMIWPYATTYQDKEDEWHFRPYARHSIVAVINDEPIAATPDWAHEGRPMVSVPEFIARCYEQVEINKKAAPLIDPEGEIVPIIPSRQIQDHEKRIKALEENDFYRADMAQRLNRVEECVSKLEGAAPTPPIGLIPHYIWIDKRYREVCDAITRYQAAKVEVPMEWWAEYETLEAKRQSRDGGGA